MKKYSQYLPKDKWKEIEDIDTPSGVSEIEEVLSSIQQKFNAFKLLNITNGFDEQIIELDKKLKSHSLLTDQIFNSNK